MSLYEALEELVGAGLLAAAPACDVEIPAGVVAKGGRLLSLLRERGVGSYVTPVIDALSREIWTGRDSRGTPYQISEVQARQLVGILEKCRPGTQDIAAAIEKARSGYSGNAANAAAPPSHAIAERILQRAKAAGLLADPQTSEATSLFLLERLFTHLLDDPALLNGLKPALVEFLARQAATPPSVPAAVNSGATTPAAHGRNLGLTEAQHQHFAARSELAALAEICERTALGPQPLQRFLEALERTGVKAESRVARLAEMAEWLKETRAQLTRASNEDAESRRLKARAAAALLEGDFEVAMDCLKQVRRHLRDGRRRIEARLQDEVTGLRAQMVEEAGATARLAELALARHDFPTAAELFAEATDHLPNGETLSAWRLTMRQGEALHRQGDEAADVAALARAALVYADALKIAGEGDLRFEMAATNAALGHALARLGEHDKGTEKVLEATAAYRRAIAGIGRDRDARLWALTQMRLGMALSLMGERGGGAAPYRDAAGSFREALKEFTREKTPQDWAAVQMGLGQALLGLEEAEPSRQLLAEAGLAYGEALTVLTRERQPSEWATAQLNLGNALLGLAEAEGMSARLEDAVAAYRQALKVFTREAVPQQWALAQMNLANALASLGDRDASASSRHEEAVKAYNLALEVFTRESQPLRWAITQMNLGTALIRLGERRDKRQHWLAAAAAMVPALEVFETEGATDYADLTRRNLRKFHEQWEQLIGPVPSMLPPNEARARVVAKAG